MQQQGREPLLFFEFCHHYGGSLNSTIQLIQAIRDRREVVVIDAYGTCREYLQALREAGIPVFVLFPGCTGRTTIGGSGLFKRIAALLFALPMFVKTIYRLRRGILNLRPEIVWVNSEKALFAAWLAVPLNIPLVTYVRENLQKTRWYCTLAWRRANLAIGVSVESLRFLRSTPLAHRNFQVIYNGVDAEAVDQRSRALTNDLPPVIPGGLRMALPANLGSPLKGHETAIRALAQWIQAGGKGQLLLCGDVPPGAPGDTLARLQRIVEESGLQDSVYFLGWRKDIFAIMASCDLILLPSFSEGLPRALLEGMALGKPVIASAVGGVPELVRDGVEGLLVRPGDVVGLAQAYERLADPSLRERMGRAAYCRVSESFRLSHQAVEFLRTMDHLAKQR